MDKSDVVAFDNEKRLYKDEYVKTFRSVRYFPVLAAVERTDSDSIVLVHEPQSSNKSPSKKDLRCKFNDVASRFARPDSLEKIFETTLPLTAFRSAILCKHTKARQQYRSEPSSTSSAKRVRSGMHRSMDDGKLGTSSSNKGTHGTIRTVKSDEQSDQNNSPKSSSILSTRPQYKTGVTPRANASPKWVNNNPASARKAICSQTFLHMPSQGTIKADRKYTDEFIRLHMGGN